MAKDPLHGITLEKIVTELAEQYGWQQLGEQVKINCFLFDPSVNSSLKFLRRVPWARAKVEELYVWHADQLAKEKLAQEKLAAAAAPVAIEEIKVENLEVTQAEETKEA